MAVVEDATETESEEGTDTEPGLAPVLAPAREKRSKRKERSGGMEGERPPGKHSLPECPKHGEKN
jgi:hypothetical protein